MTIQKIMVIGAGQMGSGIAQVAALKGYEVILHDLEEPFVARGLENIRKQLNRSVEKGVLSPEGKESALAKIRTSTDLHNAATVELVIEAAVENMAVKKQIFAELDDICPPTTIFATNTSSLPITELAAATKRSEKVIGMHFFNPVPVMKLVEIIRGLVTSKETYDVIYDLTRALGKEPVKVADYPGFVVNRLLLPMINEAVYAVYEGVASIEDVDRAMQLGANHPMGPLALADLIGLDTCLAIMETLYEGYKDGKYRPCPLLRKYVKAGWLGRKSGRGFYTYEK